MCSGRRKEAGYKGLDRCVTLRDTVRGIGLLYWRKKELDTDSKHPKNRGCVYLFPQVGIKHLMDK